ncbi:hypothetical protein ACHAXT_007018 [Thalassiosira profunda]
MPPIVKGFKRDVYPTVVLPDSNATVDHYFMGMALQQAQFAWNKGEVPIGALIVRECDDDAENNKSDDEHATIEGRRGRTFQILSAAHNRVETDVDASAHAEMLAFASASAELAAFRIDHVVYGAPDNRLGAVKTHMNLLSAATHPYHEIKSVTEGVRKEECGDVMVRFFRERRQQKKDAKSGKGKLLKLRPTKKKDGKKRQSRLGRLVKSLLRRRSNVDD